MDAERKSDDCGTCEHARQGKQRRVRSASTESKRRRSRSERLTQSAFAFGGRGGARKGAGRKPKGARAGIPHRSRPAHSASVPVQATTRLKAGLPSLRHAREFVLLRRAIAAASATPSFRVIHHSIQSNHLHLIVEAADRPALSMGMRALLVRIARALNRLWQRSGPVFADRHHERALRTPAEVRNSLVYVLQNARKHGIAASGPDAYSSGPWFDGWVNLPGLSEALERQRRRIEARFAEVWGLLAGVRRDGPSPPAGLEASEPTTWLLRIGWRRKGLLGVEERPRTAAGSSAPRVGGGIHG